MAFQNIQSALTDYHVFPTKNDVAKTATHGVRASEGRLAALFAAISNAVNWVVTGFDYVTATGLNATFNAGAAIIAGRRFATTGTFVVALADASTNHVWLTWTADGSNNATGLGVEVNTTGTPPSTPYAKIATVTTSGGSVTGNTDARTLDPPYAALVGGVLPAEKGGTGADLATSSGLLGMDAGVGYAATPGVDYYAPGEGPLDTADGGTGSATAADARTALAIAPATGPKYWVKTANGELANEQALSGIATGLIKHASGVPATATANTDYTAPGGTDVALADGGTGASLTDPNADRILFWDDSAGTLAWLTVGSYASITGTTLARTGGLPMQVPFRAGGQNPVAGVSATESYVYHSTTTLTEPAVFTFRIPTGATAISAATLYTSSGNATEATHRISVDFRVDGEDVQTGGATNTVTNSTWYTQASASLLNTIDVSGLFSSGWVAGDLCTLAIGKSSGTAAVIAMHLTITWS